MTVEDANPVNCQYCNQIRSASKAPGATIVDMTPVVIVGLALGVPALFGLAAYMGWLK